MSRPPHSQSSMLLCGVIKLFLRAILTFAFAQAASGQTLNVLHTFTGGADGGKASPDCRCRHGVAADSVEECSPRTRLT